MLQQTVVTCDHRPTAVAVALRLGAPVLHKHMYRARNLGIDHSVLRPRRWRSTGGVFTERFRAAHRRMVRLRRLRRVAARSVGRLFQASVRPALTHGSEVHGLSPNENRRV